MAISRSGSTSGAFLGAGPVAGSDPQDERISGYGVDCSELGIMFNTTRCCGNVVMMRARSAFQWDGIVRMSRMATPTGMRAATEAP